MNKYFLLLCFLIITISSCKEESFLDKFLQNKSIVEDLTKYPSEFLKGLLEAFKVEAKINFPEIRKCIDNDIGLKQTFDTLLNDISDFKGKKININNFLIVIVDFGHLLMKIKAKHQICLINTNSEINFIIHKLEDFLMNFPPNFKKYYQNFSNGKGMILELLSDVEIEFDSNAFQVGHDIGEMIKIILQKANYHDTGLESFEEFELFNTCYSSLALGPSIDLQALNDLMKTIFKQEKIEDLLYSLSNMFAVLSDRISYCYKYLSHLNQ